MRTYLKENFRGFAARLADSPLLQHFCLVDEIDRVQVPAKSTLQRYAHWTDEKTLQEVIHKLCAKLTNIRKNCGWTNPWIWTRAFWTPPV